MGNLSTPARPPAAKAAGELSTVQKLQMALHAKAKAEAGYSPDFNPIEKAFSKLKALLRKAAERTVEGLWTKIGEFLSAVTPRECANFFAAAGHEPL